MELILFLKTKMNAVMKDKRNQSVFVLIIRFPNRIRHFSSG
ncbi:hypothetical protein JMA_06880 [Jeotgalibacillus malaysiensis]|uniref:Uncharacterized protein n=1 Tax=Jeotgalibacillus malaysiensis TaxID=1508404 RepID=A0A0B5AHY4_9BACL|nr:hypothetical protein JMA_06880 [Jeotgalibacillus malaysiensis]